MASFKVLLVVALMVVPLLASPVYEEHKEVEVEHYAHPKYEFKYGVRDEHTHDIKEQAEKRDGDKVEGYYTLLEADGTTRTVHYSSDKHTGFIAQVHKSGHSVHPNQVHKKVAVAHVAPVIAHHVAPVIAHQPVHIVAPVITHHAVHAAPSYSQGGRSSGSSYSHRAQSSGPSYSQRAESSGPSYSFRAEGSGPSYSQRSESSGPSYSYRAQSPSYSQRTESAGPSYSYRAEGSGPSYSQRAEGSGASSSNEGLRSYAQEGGSNGQRSSYSQHISHGAPSYGHHGLGSSASYSHQPSHGGATSYSNFEFFADGGNKP